MPAKPKVDIDKVKQLHAQGVAVRCIAERMGYSKGAVYGVLRPKTQGGAK